jgi:long-subunit acyl-CoA synthetase (AMP-forming)
LPFQARNRHELTDEQKLYIDANDASRWLSANQIREKVRQLISGFNYHGLGAQDCVCVVSFNDVSKNLSTLEKLDITWANF